MLILCAILFGTGLRMGLGALLLIGTIKVLKTVKPNKDLKLIVIHDHRKTPVSSGFGSSYSASPWY